MAKVSLARKKELSEPDEFISMSNKALDYARKNKTTITAVVAGAVAVVVFIAGFQYYSQNRENKAFVKYASDMDWYETVSKDKKDDMSLKAVKEKGDSFFAKYSGTAAALLAQAKYAGIYYDEKDYSAAATLYENLLSEIKNDDALKNVTLCALAQCYEAMGKIDQAVSRYEEILSGDNSIKKDEALFHLGLIYEKKGDMAKSHAAFARIPDEFSDSLFLDIAKSKINS